MFEEYITEVAKHKREFKTPKMTVPVVFHIEEKLMPGQATMEQLESVASNGCVFHHIAAMADVHSKPGRKNATGTTVASEKFILPQVNDSDPACGMRLVRTNLNDTNVTPEELEKLFQALVEIVPPKKFIGTYLPFRVIVDICRQGIAPLIEYLGIQTKNETINCIERGNFFGKAAVTAKDIFNVIPKLFLFFAQIRAGVLGAAGNHFLDLMKVTDIVDEETARKFNLSQGQYVFMVHCGSGILGQYSMYMYTAKKREHLSQAAMVTLGRLFFWSPFKKTAKKIARLIKEFQYGTKEELLAYHGESEEGKLYMTARKACSNFAHANRATITHNVSETIKAVLGRDPEFDLLYDMPHILVSQEEHYGQNLWVHRNGTSRAYGKTRMQDHPLFRETGEPAFIPSSMSTEAYLSVGQDGNESSFYSCNHLAAKATEKTDTIVPHNKAELDKKLAGKGVRLYNGRSSKVIEQDSSHYKRIEDVIESVTENNIVKPVAKMQPVAIIMY